MNFFVRMVGAVLTALSLLVAMLLLASAYSPWVEPTVHPQWSCLGLAFPLGVVANGVLLVLWLIVRSYRRALIPLLAFALCLPQLRTYCPIRLGTREAGEESIRLLSYNVMAFNACPKDADGSHPILTYIRESGADIICMQEFNIGHGSHEVRQRDVDRALSEFYPYHNVTPAQPRSSNILACYSRYPILTAERLAIVSEHNGAVLYRILLPQGDTLCLINNHLETNSLSPEDKEIYADLLHGPDRATAEAGARHLLSKLSQATAIRGPQADSVARVIDRLLARDGASTRLSHLESDGAAPPTGDGAGPTPQRPRLLVVACGDLNDSPISYARRRLASHLRDVYAHAGHGLGISYNRNHFLFRIDHIFADRRLEATDCRVDRSINASDHYPIVATLTLP